MPIPEGVEELAAGPDSVEKANLNLRKLGKTGEMVIKMTEDVDPLVNRALEQDEFLKHRKTKPKKYTSG